MRSFKNVPHKILILKDENKKFLETGCLVAICFIYRKMQDHSNLPSAKQCGLGAEGGKGAARFKPVNIVLQMGMLAERVGTWLRSDVGAA